jgi:hypothetical protein
MSSKPKSKVSGGRLLRKRRAPQPPEGKRSLTAFIIPNSYDPATRTVKFVAPLVSDKDATKH